MMSAPESYLPRADAHAPLLAAQLVPQPVAPAVEKMLRQNTGADGEILRLSATTGLEGTYCVGTGAACSIIKLMSGRHTEREAAVNALLTKLAADAPVVRAKEMRLLDATCGLAMFVYPFIEANSPRPVAGDLARVGRLAAALHRSLAWLDHSAIAAASAARLAMLRETAELLRSNSRKLGPEPQLLAEIAAWSWTWEASVADQPLHGDLHGGNILLGRDGTDVVIDCEDVPHSFGPALLDLAFAMERLCLVPAQDETQACDGAAALFTGYLGGRSAMLPGRRGDLAAALRFLNWRSLMILAALELRGETAPPSEWNKFFQLWSSAEKFAPAIAEIEARFVGHRA
jgi:Ser/Thr protein kinase RdoA (MazF antagonist)